MNKPAESRLNKYTWGARLATAVIALMALGVAGPVQAVPEEGAAGIKVAPVKVDTELKRGETAEVEFTVTNTGGVPVKLSLESQNFTRDDEGNYRFFEQTERPPAASAAAWLSWSRPRGELKPGESKTVRADIQVPEKAEPGTHFAMVFVLADPVPGPQEQKGAVVIGRPRIGVMLRATVEGKIIDKLKLAGFEVRRFNWGGPVDFRVLFDNQGNVHKDIAGRITVANNNGEVAKIPITEWTSLPHSDLNIKAAWDKPSFGSFKATAVMASRDGEEWQRSATFYVFPLRQALFGAALVLILLGLWRFLRGRYSFRVERKEGDSN